MDDQPSSRKKSLFPPARIIALVLLAAAIVVYLLEMRARRSAQAAYDEIEQRLPSDDAPSTKAPPTADEVRKLVGRGPDTSTAVGAGLLQETYTWAGPFKKYTVWVVYKKAAVPVLYQVYLNQPPP